MLRVPLAAIVAAAFAALSQPAFAHAHLLSSTPAANASVATITDIVLNFSERIEPAFTGLSLKSSEGEVIATGAAAVDGSNAATIAVPVGGSLAAGRYEVDWHALAVDGHKTSGSFDFSIAP